MSNISPNCLFHFTPKAEYLIGILKNEFLPRYCMEEIKLHDHGDFNEISSGIPMVCFCDISLSQLSKHISTYGSYGIGMNKEWGIKNKLNPLIYINEKSKVAEPFGRIALTALKLMKADIKTENKLNRDLINLADDWRTLAMYLKPYEGSLIRNNSQIKNIRFYDEREWRYLPETGGEASTISLTEDEMKDPIKLANENQKLEKYKLSFEPHDIKYIFVKSESEIHSMVEALRGIKSPKYDSKTIDILTSKILTTHQILEDF